MGNHKSKIVAHRGASFHFPENTLLAFTEAHQNHCAEMIELDVQETSDGVVVVMHDARLERTTNGTGYVRERSWSELKKLDAGYFFKKEGTDEFPFRSEGIRIPMLAEVLEALPETAFAVEIKERSARLTDKVARLLKTHATRDFCIAGSKYEVVSKRMRTEHAHLKRFCSRTELAKLLFEMQLPFETSKEDPLAVASVPLNSMGISFNTQAWINHLKKRKVQSYYWTIDEPQTMLELQSFGADGIITNVPSLAAETLA